MLKKTGVFPEFFFLVERPDIHSAACSTLDDKTVVAFTLDERIRPFAGTLQMVGALGNVRHSEGLYIFPNYVASPTKN
jgi:hypothetical protein